jgi:hypothetical protein
VTDLERLFRALVQRLAATDPARLHQPIPLHDLQTSIIPYRAIRRAVGVESSEDYEMLLLHLAAGEGGFARTEPANARERLLKESRSAHPELGVLGELGQATLVLSTEEIAYALGPEPQSSFAPPTPEAAAAPRLIATPVAHSIEEPDAGEPEIDVDDAEVAESAHCLYCGGTLPLDRTVNFCPHCGANQREPRCPACQSEVELGWRHCVSCGAALPL